MALLIECEEYFGEVLAFAKANQAEETLNEQLRRLKVLAGEDLCHLHKDFAPLSFAFMIESKSRRRLIGGLIYSGPHQVLDGSAPTFTVSVDAPSNEHKWSIHT